jgi:hypothetical protein
MQCSAQFELDLRDTAQIERISPQKPRTIQELLECVECEPASRQLQSMMRSTANHIAQCFGRPLDAIQVTELAHALPQLRAFLTERRFKRNSIRSYLNYVRILLRKAHDFGWVGIDPDVEAAWAPVLGAIPSQNWLSKTRSIVRYAIQRNVKPSAFGESELESWSEWMLKQGRKRSYVRSLSGNFRSFVFRNGFPTALNDIYAEGGVVFRIAFENLPEPLRSEVTQLLDWKVAEFSRGRPERNRHRPVTAKNFRDLLCRIVGFLERVQRKRVASLKELLTEDNLRDFVEWSINKRKVKGYYFISWFGMLYSSVRMYPGLKGTDFSWLGKLIEELPVKDAEGQKQAAKKRKWVDYEIVFQIPARIRAERLALKSQTSRGAALLCRNELLMTWLTTLPWRQRNLRECKLGHQEHGGNLFKERLSEASTIAKPRWVEDALNENRQDAFWQFLFRPDETKTSHRVHSLLPRQLIPILEEYLERYRPLLVNGEDPQTLFLNDAGRPISSEGIFTIVGNITYQCVRRRINPHLFRDIFAVRWLEKNPEDYLSVSKILWHRNIQTTLRIYGRNFDESHGVRRIEEWLDVRNRDSSKPSEIRDFNSADCPSQSSQ